MAKEKITYEMVQTTLELVEKELQLFNNLKTLGLSPAKVRNEILKQRKQAEKQAEKERKQAEKVDSIAKKAVEKIANAKALYAELKNLQDFAGYEKPALTIKNVSNYQNFKGRTWQVFGKLEIQNEIYVVSLEYDKDGNFALPCFINIEDIIIEDSQVKILDYEKDNCLPMVYEKV